MLTSLAPLDWIEENRSLRTCERCGTSETFPKPDPATLEAQYSEAYYGPDNVKFVPAVEAFVAWMTRKRAARVHALIGRTRPNS